MVDLAKDFKLVMQGAEAKLYLGTYLGQKAIAKERFPKHYRHPTLDEQLTRERFKGEVRSIIRCKSAGVRTPTIYLADAQTSVIVMEYLEDAVTAKEFIRSSAAGETGARRSELLGAEIGRTLGRMHRAVLFLPVIVIIAVIKIHADQLIPAVKLLLHFWRFSFLRDLHIQRLSTRSIEACKNTRFSNAKNPES